MVNMLIRQVLIMLTSEECSHDSVQAPMFSAFGIALSGTAPFLVGCARSRRFA
jgi:hypothetical protein